MTFRLVRDLAAAGMPGAQVSPIHANFFINSGGATVLCCHTGNRCRVANLHTMFLRSRGKCSGNCVHPTFGKEDSID